MHQEIESIELLSGRRVRHTRSLGSPGVHQRLYVEHAHSLLNNRLIQGADLPSRRITSLADTPSKSPVARRAFANGSFWARQSQISWKWLRATSPLRHEIRIAIPRL
jgi:hypothetical protein